MGFNSGFKGLMAVCTWRRRHPDIQGNPHKLCPTSVWYYES